MSVKKKPPKHPASPRSRALGYEPKDVKARYVVYSVIVLFSTVALFFAIVGGIISIDGPQRGAPPSVLDTVVKKDGPRLEVDPEGDRRKLEAAAKSEIETYAWVDKSTGVARIPIERAMALMAEQGWPDKDNAPASAEPKQGDTGP